MPCGRLPINRADWASNNPLTPGPKMNFPPPTPRQASMIWIAVTGLAIALLLALVVGLVWGLGQVLRVLAPVLWPLAVAGVIAYLLDPVVDWLERKKVPRSRGIVCVFALGLVVVAALFSSVVPQAINETHQLALRIPEYATKVQQRVEHLVHHPPDFLKRILKRDGDAAPALDTAATNLPTSGSATNTSAVSVAGDAATNAPASVRPESGTTDTPSFFGAGLDERALQTATGLITKFGPRFGSWITGQVGKMASWFGILAGLCLVPVYAFYLLLEKRGIQSKWTDYLPVSDSGFKDEVVFVIASINDYLIAFFRGQVLVAICDGILYTVGFLIIGLPYAVLVGVMATFLTMIPFIGAIVTCVSALLIMTVTHGDWQHPLMVLAVFAVVQALEGLVISPKIMGERVGLHPITIIIAVMVGTTLMGGLLGGILAIPLTAALRVVMFRYVWKRPSEANP